MEGKQSFRLKVWEVVKLSGAGRMKGFCKRRYKKALKKMKSGKKWMDLPLM